MKYRRHWDLNEVKIEVRKIEVTEEFTTRWAFMQYFVYILECSDQSLYVGCTNNLARRIKQHNESKWGAHYTKLRRPVKLLHSEQFDSLKIARKRESEIKSWRREKKLLLVLRKSKD